MVQFITENISPPSRRDYVDKAWWVVDKAEQFSIKLAFELLRRRKAKQE